jgi:hypothetical protein
MHLAASRERQTLRDAKRDSAVHRAINGFSAV